MNELSQVFSDRMFAIVAVVAIVAVSATALARRGTRDASGTGRQPGLVNEPPQPISGRLVAGIALVALGAIWTLDNLGLTDAKAILRWWPALLVAAGLAKLSGWGFRRSPGVGAAAVVVGLVLLAGELGFPVGLGLLFPLALIALGVQVMVRGGRVGQSCGTIGNSSDYIRQFALLGGSSTRGLSQSFRGAELSAVLGGIELDLREAKPSENRVVVDAFAFMGGIDLIVPAGWRLEVEASPIMGAIQDDRTAGPPLEPGPTLLVRGAVIVGGLVLRSAPGVRVAQVGVITRRRGRYVSEVRVSSSGVHVQRTEIDPNAPPPAGPGAPPPPTEPH